MKSHCFKIIPPLIALIFESNFKIMKDVIIFFPFIIELFAYILKTYFIWFAVLSGLLPQLKL